MNFFSIENILLFAIVCTAFVIIIRKSIQIVGSQNICIIERNCKSRRVLNKGIHFIIPYIDEIVYKSSLDKEELHETLKSCVTADNVEMNIEIVVSYMLKDVKKLVNAENYDMQMYETLWEIVQTKISGMPLESVLADTGDLTSAVMESLDTYTSIWGIKILGCKILEKMYRN